MKRAFTEHWGLKLLSLVLAFILWFVVLREEKVVMVMRAPIEFKNIPPQMVVVNDPEDLVSVKIRGAKSLVSGFVPSQIDLPQGDEVSRLRGGNNYIHIDPKQISAPRGIEVLGVTPATIHLVLERLVEKELSIAPHMEGSLPQGFYLRRATVSPASIKVKGPHRALRELNRIFTESISLEGKRETFRHLVYLESPGSQISWGEEETARVMVTVEIAKREE